MTECECFKVNGKFIGHRSLKTWRSTNLEVGMCVCVCVALPTFRQSTILIKFYLLRKLFTLSAQRGHTKVTENEFLHKVHRIVNIRLVVAFLLFIFQFILSALVYFELTLLVPERFMSFRVYLWGADSKCEVASILHRIMMIKPSILSDEFFFAFRSTAKENESRTEIAFTVTWGFAEHLNRIKKTRNK